MASSASVFTLRRSYGKRKGNPHYVWKVFDSRDRMVAKSTVAYTTSDAMDRDLLAIKAVMGAARLLDVGPGPAIDFSTDDDPTTYSTDSDPDDEDDHDEPEP